MHERPADEQIVDDQTSRTGGSRGRWARAGRLGAFVALVAGIAIGSATTSVVWATHSFPDVPTSSPHHDDISWAVANGITQGYNDGTFRPTQAVSRQTMATFLRRLNGELTMVSQNTPTSGGENQNIRQASAFCGAGRRAIAGGGTATGENLYMRASYPSADQWFVAWETENNAAIGSRTLTVWALCAPGL